MACADCQRKAALRASGNYVPAGAMATPEEMAAAQRNAQTYMQGQLNYTYLVAGIGLLFFFLRSRR